MSDAAEKLSIERLDVEAFLSRKKVTYVDVNNLFELYDGLSKVDGNVVVEGPKGCGKSLSVAAWTIRKGFPIVTYDCSEDVRRSHLIGQFVLRGDQTPFVMGPLCTALDVANEVGNCVLVLEEMNALTPQMQKVLNALTDWRRSIEVPEARKVFRLEEGKKLFIAGTMNSTVYGGTFALNEDLKSRFRLIPVDYPGEKEEGSVLTQVMDARGIKMNGDHMTKLLTLAHETRQRAISYALSTRDLAAILEDISVFGLNKALWMMTGKFEDDDRATVIARIQSTFGIDLRNTKKL